jgi:hypothetical protein
MSDATRYRCDDQGNRPQTLHAYVLIETENGRALDVARAIAGADGIITASAVSGPYDVIALAAATPNWRDPAHWSGLPAL